MTVDNGISAVEEADYAAELGIDLIITDHHLPPETLPKAIAVVDPRREDDTSPFKACAVRAWHSSCVPHWMAARRKKCWTTAATLPLWVLWRT